MKKAYHISFTFNMKQPGVITITGEDEDTAKKNFFDLMKDFSDVVIQEVVDLDTIPSLKQQLQDREQFEKMILQEDIEDAEIIEPNKVN